MSGSCWNLSVFRRSTAPSTWPGRRSATSGDPRNREFVAGRVEVGAGVPETLDALGYDPQTAGGLLVSIPAEQEPALEAEFESAKLFVRRVGMVEEGAGVSFGEARNDPWKVSALPQRPPRTC